MIKNIFYSLYVFLYRKKKKKRIKEKGDYIY